MPVELAILITNALNAASLIPLPGAKPRSGKLTNLLWARLVGTGVVILIAAIIALVLGIVGPTRDLK